MPNPSPRLAARVVASTPHWDPTFTVEQKVAVELAYGVSISEQAWGELHKHLHSYAAWAAHELKAASVSDLRDALQILSDACIGFGNVIAPHSPLKTPDVTGLKSKEAERLLAEATKRQSTEIHTKQALLAAIDEQWEDIFHPFTKGAYARQAMLSDMQTHLTEAGAADAESTAYRLMDKWDKYGLFPRVNVTDQVREAVNEMHITIGSLEKALAKGELPTVAPGDAWETLVRGLLHWAKQFGYPDGVTAGVNRPVSPFVKFVAALQSIMPKEYRRHASAPTVAPTALASAIKKLKPKRHAAETK